MKIFGTEQTSYSVQAANCGRSGLTQVYKLSMFYCLCITRPCLTEQSVNPQAAIST